MHSPTPWRARFRAQFLFFGSGDFSARRAVVPSVCAPRCRAPPPCRARATPAAAAPPTNWVSRFSLQQGSVFTFGFYFLRARVTTMGGAPASMRPILTQLNFLTFFCRDGDALSSPGSAPHTVLSRERARDVSMVNMRYYLSTKDACYAPNAKNADPISLRWPHNVVREG